MSKVVGTETTIEMMVNCKTYPAVSTKYTETVCTGGVTADGDFIRLYPIPFRFLHEGEQYDRWDVIRVRAYRSSKDTRPESWHIEPGVPIEIVDKVSTERARWKWMSKTVHESTDVMHTAGITNGCVEIEPLELYWREDEREWRPSQLNVIRQGDLFANREKMPSLADKVPWQFRLRYREKKSGKECDGKVLAWSWYQGYQRRLRELGNEQSALGALVERVKASIFNPKRAVFAIMGTHSKWGSWMISGLYHLPRTVLGGDKRQGSLF